MMYNPLYQNLAPFSYQYNTLNNPFDNKTEPYFLCQRKINKPFVNVLQNIHISSPYLMNYNYYMCNHTDTNNYFQPLYSSFDDFKQQTQEMNSELNASIPVTEDKNESKENENASQSTSSISCSVFLGKKRRLRKNKSQLHQLSTFYKENKIWSKLAIKKISEETGLKENKVYKWLWDQKNKDLKRAKFFVNK